MDKEHNPKAGATQDLFLSPRSPECRGRTTTPVLCSGTRAKSCITANSYRNATARCGFSEEPVCSRENDRRGRQDAKMLSEVDYQEAVRRYKDMKVTGQEGQ